MAAVCLLAYLLAVAITNDAARYQASILVGMNMSSESNNPQRVTVSFGGTVIATLQLKLGYVCVCVAALMKHFE